MRPVVVRSATILLAGWLTGAPAMAATLDLTGTYGNAAGCRYVATQDYSDDTMLILNKDEWQTYVSLCEFLQVLPARDGSHVLTMLCGNEGDAAQTIEFGRVAKIADADAYEFYSAAGDPHGKLERCK